MMHEELTNGLTHEVVRMYVGTYKHYAFTASLSIAAFEVVFPTIYVPKLYIAKRRDHLCHSVVICECFVTLSTTTI